MTASFLFTGQGAQSVGMGKALYDTYEVAKTVFKEVENVVNFPLRHIMFEGPEEKLKQTNYAQVALMTVGMAVVRVLEEKKEKPLWEMGTFCAGHSLGEYTALCATGALTLQQTALLLKARGEAFLKCAEHYPGGMLAVLGMEKDALQHVLNQAVGTSMVVCVIANDNADGQIVVSGEEKVLEMVKMMVSMAGAKRAIRLPLSGAFHSPLMQEAAAEMKEVILGAEMQIPKIPVISNVTALPESNPTVIKDLLVKQITSPVLWRDSMIYLKNQGIDTLIECGGKVLTGMNRRTLPLLTHIALEKGDEY